MRKANISDIKSVIKIVKPYYEQKIMGIYPMVYYGAAKKENLWVLENDETIIGFIMIKILKRTNKLRLIQIAKDQNQKNIGQILIDKVVELAKQFGCDAIILDVVETNSKAISFYKRNNFLEIEQKLDKKVMELSLR